MHGAKVITQPIYNMDSASAVADEEEGRKKEQTLSNTKLKTTWKERNNIQDSELTDHWRLFVA